MPIVEIKGYGVEVEFPDTMTDAEIEAALRDKVMPQLQAETAASDRQALEAMTPYERAQVLERHRNGGAQTVGEAVTQLSGAASPVANAGGGPSSSPPNGAAPSSRSFGQAVRDTGHNALVALGEPARQRLALPGVQAALRWLAGMPMPGANPAALLSAYDQAAAGVLPEDVRPAPEGAGAWERALTETALPGLAAFADPVNMGAMIAGGAAAAPVAGAMGLGGVAASPLASAATRGAARAMQAGLQSGGALGAFGGVEAAQRGEGLGGIAAAAGKNAALGMALGPAGAAPGGVAGKLLTEVGVFGLLGPAMEGRLPSEDDVVGAIVMIGGLNAARGLSPGAIRGLLKRREERTPEEAQAVDEIPPEQLQAVVEEIAKAPEPAGEPAATRPLTTAAQVKTPEEIQAVDEIPPEQMQAVVEELAQRDPGLATIHRAERIAREEPTRYQVQEAGGVPKATPLPRETPDQTKRLLAQVPDDVLLSELAREQQSDSRRRLLQEEFDRRTAAPEPEPQGEINQADILARQKKGRRLALAQSPTRSVTVGALKAGDRVKTVQGDGKVVKVTQNGVKVVTDAGATVSLFRGQRIRRYGEAGGAGAPEFSAPQERPAVEPRPLETAMELQDYQEIVDLVPERAAREAVSRETPADASPVEPTPEAEAPARPVAASEAPQPGKVPAPASEAPPAPAQDPEVKPKGKAAKPGAPDAMRTRFEALDDVALEKLAKGTARGAKLAGEILAERKASASQAGFLNLEAVGARAPAVPRSSIGRAVGAASPKRKLPSANEAYTRAVDDLHPLRRLVERAQKAGAKIADWENPYILARNARGWVGAAEHFLQRGALKVGAERRLERAGESFKDIFKDLDEQQVSDLREYVIARRLRARADKYTPEALAEMGIDPADIDRVLNEYGRYERLAQRWNAYNDTLAKFAFGEDSRIYKALTASGDFYVPLFRVLDPEPRRTLGAKVRADAPVPVKRLKGGGDLAIMDPIEGTIRNTYLLSQFRAMREVGESLAEVSTRADMPDLIQQIARPVQPVKLSAAEVERMAKLLDAPVDTELAQDVVLFREAFRRGTDPIIKVEVGGKAKFYKLDPELHGAVQNMNRQQLHWLMTLLGAPARTLRAGAVLAPEFMARNPIRDVSDQYMFSKYGANPIRFAGDWVRGFFSSIKRDDAYWRYVANGGLQSSFVALDQGQMTKGYARLMAGRRLGLENFKHVALHPLDALRTLSAFTEEATRISESERATRAGEHPIRATFEGRDITVDFARAGEYSRQVNGIMPFFTAAIGGMDKMRRTFKERPMETAIKAAATVTLPSALLTLYNLKHHKDEWGRIPDWERNTAWIFFMPDGTPVKIPKPHDLGVVFGSAVERAIEWAVEDDPDQLEAMLKALGAMAPGGVPTAVQPWIENFANRKVFFDGPVVPEPETGKVPELQYSRYTSETFKTLGRLLNVSPAKLENVYSGYTGGLGRYLLEYGLDPVVSRVTPGDRPQEPAKGLAQMPLTRGFVSRGTGRQTNRFYERADKIESKYRSRGEVKMTSAELHAYGAVKAAKKDLKKLRKTRDEIESSRDLSPAQKRDLLDALYRQMDDVAKSALVRMGRGE